LKLKAKKIDLFIFEQVNFGEVISMYDWEPGDDIDWLTGEYTYKRARLRKILREGRGHE
jgi:hypothetical protein